MSTNKIFLSQKLGIPLKEKKSAKEMMSDFIKTWHPEKVETGVYTLKAYSETWSELKDNKLRLK